MNKDAQLGLREVPLEGLDDWIAEDLLRPHSVLSREQIGRANAAGELDMFLLYFKADDEHLSDPGRRCVVQELMLHAFPRGYHLRSLTGRVRCRGQITSGLRAGVHLLRPESVSPGPDEFLPFPVLLYIDRERVEFASWVAGAFIWSRPRFQFSPGARRTLTLATRGYRDEDIVAECGVSASTIKKRWDSIFERVSSTSPDFFHEPADRVARPGRGPVKRRLLLHYIAAHPEELRPYSWLAAQDPVDMVPGSVLQSPPLSMCGRLSRSTSLASVPQNVRASLQIALMYSARA